MLRGVWLQMRKRCDGDDGGGGDDCDGDVVVTVVDEIVRVEEYHVILMS